MPSLAIGGILGVVTDIIDLSSQGDVFVAAGSVDTLPVSTSEFLENQAMTVHSENSENYTGGHANNTLKVTVIYAIVDV